MKFIEMIINSQDLFICFSQRNCKLTVFSDESLLHGITFEAYLKALGGTVLLGTYFTILFSSLPTVFLARLPPKLSSGCPSGFIKF